jgi:phosphatidylethanolamine-binding protein (PEBP) family uncharacterized protein
MLSSRSPTVLQTLRRTSDEHWLSVSGNVLPALEWRGTSCDVQSFALMVEDPDVPSGTFRHRALCKLAANTTSLPDVVAILLQGNRDVMQGFTAEEVKLLTSLLERLVANFDHIASVEESSHDR